MQPALRYTAPHVCPRALSPSTSTTLHLPTTHIFVRTAGTETRSWGLRAAWRFLQEMLALLLEKIPEGMWQLNPFWPLKAGRCRLVELTGFTVGEPCPPFYPLSLLCCLLGFLFSLHTVSVSAKERGCTGPLCSAPAATSALQARSRPRKHTGGLCRLVRLVSGF